MDWIPLSEASLWDKLNAAESRMGPEQTRLWNLSRIPPKKWSQEPYGVEGGGFWVVAILGSLVVWYNDIEEGFNCSSYSEFGKIKDYWCNQDELECVIQNLCTAIRDGQFCVPRATPPISGAYPGA